MKGKKLLTLLSLAMGLAIVGGTFAAWAVTDNADPFGIKVSPGQVGPDETKFVTLSYGESSFKNVDKLEAGKPRLAGSIVLKAENKKGEAFPYGQFDVKLKDQSTGKALTDPWLVDLLRVDVYNEEVKIESDTVTLKAGGAASPVCSLPNLSYVKDEDITDASSFNESLAEHGRLFKKVESNYVVIASYDSGVTEYFYQLNKTKYNMEIPAAGYPVWVVVSLNASTDAMVLEKIAKDVVYLEMDLNKADVGDYTTTSAIYVGKEAGDGEKVYCYAWSAKNKNADWPGVEMTSFGNGYYSYELKTEFDKVIFHSAKKVSEEWKSSWQTVDLSIDNDIRTLTPSFSPTAATGEGGKWVGTWGEAPDPELNRDWYIVGNKKGNWSPDKSYGLTMVGLDENHYSITGVTFDAGEQIKITNPNKTVWYSCESTYDNCGYTIDDKGNVVVTEAGTYTVELYRDSPQHNYIKLTKNA